MPREQPPSTPDVRPGTPDDNADPDAWKISDPDCGGWAMVHHDWNARAAAESACVPARTRRMTKVIAAVRLLARGFWAPISRVARRLFARRPRRGSHAGR